MMDILADLAPMLWGLAAVAIGAVIGWKLGLL